MNSDAAPGRFEPGKTYRCLTADSIFHCDHITQGVAIGVGTARNRLAPKTCPVFHPRRDPGEWVEEPGIPFVSEAEYVASLPPERRIGPAPARAIPPQETGRSKRQGAAISPRDRAAVSHLRSSAQLLEAALRDEQVPDGHAERVVNRFLFGHPDPSSIGGVTWRKT